MTAMIFSSKLTHLPFDSSHDGLDIAHVAGYALSLPIVNAKGQTLIVTAREQLVE